MEKYLGKSKPTSSFFSHLSSKNKDNNANSCNNLPGNKIKPESFNQDIFIVLLVANEDLIIDQVFFCVGEGKLSGEPHDILDQLGASRLVVMLLTKVDKVPDVLQQSINLGISLLSGETVELQKSFYTHLSSCAKSNIFMKV